MKDNSKNRLMTTNELAEYLKVNRVTIYRYLKENKIPALKVGGEWRFRKEDIDEWIEKQAEENSKKQILVVDDEELIRNMLREILEKNDYRVSLAASGSEALEYLEVEEPNLVILDMEMPGMSGIEVLLEIRNRFLELPVVFFTSHLTKEAAVDAIKLGVDGYIKKPFDSIDNLIQTIERQILKQKHSLRVDLEQLQRQIKELEDMVFVEPDFGIYTSKYFKKRLTEEVKRAKRYSSFLSLATLNVKFLNGRGGNGRGELKRSDLQKLSKFMLSSFRDTDIIGLSDENSIGIILTETDETGAEQATQRLTEGIKNQLFADCECELSLGVASYPKSAGCASELLESSMSMLKKEKAKED